MKKRFLTAACIIMLSMIGFYSCRKDESGLNDNNGQQKVLVYLSDDPVDNFTKVIVDIQYVEVKIDSSHGHHNGHDWDDDDDHHGHDEFGHWDTLGITPGQYDLLRLRNGVDTLLASGFVAHGRITKIRFTLGDNNEVWTDSTTSQPLTICNNRHYIYAGLLTENIDTLQTGEAILRIDFNIHRSIHGWNGHYCLSPVLRPFCMRTTGSIEGKIYPFGITTLVTVFNNTDTAYAIPFWNGAFKVRGLDEGIYSVKYDPLSPYQDTVITDVHVYRGQETELPPVTLHQ